MFATATDEMNKNANEQQPATGISATAANNELLKPLLLFGPTAKFDGYSAFELREKFFPHDSQTPNLTELFEELSHLQSLGKNWFGFEIDGSCGELKCKAIAEPMGNMVLEPMVIRGNMEDNVKFRAQELGFKNIFSDRLGYEGTIEGDKFGCGYGMPEAAGGKFKMRKVWQGEEEY
jgi:hypothetical protein